MIDNLQKASVLIPGGYNTQGLTDLLKEKNISYALFTTKTTKIEEGSSTAYLSAFDRKKTRLKQFFGGKNLFVVAAVPGSKARMGGGPKATAGGAPKVTALQAADDGAESPMTAS